MRCHYCSILMGLRFRTIFVTNKDEGTLYKKLERKAKPSFPTPKHILDTKPKHIDEAQIITKESVQELMTTLRSREEDQTHQWQTQSKSIGDQSPNQNKWG